LVRIQKGISFGVLDNLETNEVGFLFQGENQLEERWLALESSVQTTMPSLTIIVGSDELKIWRPSYWPETFLLDPGSCGKNRILIIYQ